MDGHCYFRGVIFWKFVERVAMYHCLNGFWQRKSRKNNSANDQHDVFAQGTYLTDVETLGRLVKLCEFRLQKVFLNLSAVSPLTFTQSHQGTRMKLVVRWINLPSRFNLTSSLYEWFGAILEGNLFEIIILWAIEISRSAISGST